MAYVIVNSEEELEKAIKRFKRQVEKEGIIREWKKREYFEKPSTIRSRRKKALKRKQMKKQRKGGSSSSSSSSSSTSSSSSSGNNSRNY
ncbi:MAG: 30S ribosomal protein S21 [Spirochaetales bacterium]|nr:30S ribosomal protein S21 [Spirochaetales bacterium]